MLIRKVAVPLINEKILQQAEHCYLLTSGISEAGFDFIRTRISPKTKIDIVTGLDDVTSPEVLRKILSHYEGRITMKIFTRNVIHANAFIFELPFRKSVAFIGSGNLTLEGLKDHDEVFWKVSDPKEIESLFSWFTGFYEFGTLLDDHVINQYARIYPGLRRGELLKRKQKYEALSTNTQFLETVKFRTQFFKREDYDSLDRENLADFQIPESMQKLADLVQIELARIGFYPIDKLIGGQGPAPAFEGPEKSFFITFGRNASGFNPGPVFLKFGLTCTSFLIRLVLLEDSEDNLLRRKLRDKVQEPDFRKQLLSLITALGSGYVIEAAATRKSFDYFKQDQLLAEFIMADPDMYFPIIVDRAFRPGDSALNVDQITGIIVNEFGRLRQLFEFMAELNLKS